SGMSLPAYVSKILFEPLSMRDSCFTPSESLFPRIAPTEEIEAPCGGPLLLRGVVHDPTTRFMGGIAGHAGLFSTADDLGIFAAMMLKKGVSPKGESLFRAETIEKFTSPHSPVGQTQLRGIGWDIASDFSGNRGEIFPRGISYGHTGFTGTSL